MKKACVLVLYGIIILFITNCSNSQSTKRTKNEATDLINFSNIDKAWDLSKGEGVVVAIMDWSFDMKGKTKSKYVHPVSMVEGEIIGNMKPWHGEWMAQTINRVAPKVKIIPIRTRSLKKRSFQEYVADAIRYAADHGAVAVTSSMGQLLYTDEIKKAIDYAENKGMVFVDVHPELIEQDDGSKISCSGNTCDPRIIHTGIVSVEKYPAEPDSLRQVYTWPYEIDPVYQDGWGYSNGPPIVGGVIALMKSINPDLHPDDIRRILKETATLKNGFNVLNAEAAVKASKALLR